MRSNSDPDTRTLRLALLFHLVRTLQDAGKIKLQKMVYFLQEAFHVPTGYGFRMHHYGPYSEELDDDLVLLKVTGYVNISPDPEGYGFHVKPADEPEAAWGKPVAAYKNEVQRVSQLFAERPAYELELAATLHYVNHLLDPLQRSQLIEIVGSLKPRFDREQIAKMHEEMKAEGLA